MPVGPVMQCGNSGEYQSIHVPGQVLGSDIPGTQAVVCKLPVTPVSQHAA